MQSLDWIIILGSDLMQCYWFCSNHDCR